MDVKEYINSLNIDDIPWNRMVTAYGTAEKYPEYLSILDKMENLDEVKNAWNKISDFEHQSTMFAPAPFALVFLVRICEKAKKTDTPEAKWIIEKFNEDFDYYLEILDDTESMEHAEPLPSFSDMLDEEYLLPEEYLAESLTEDDLEDYLEEYDESFMSDENYFYSLYYYSGIVLKDYDKKI